VKPYLSTAEAHQLSFAPKSEESVISEKQELCESLHGNSLKVQAKYEAKVYKAFCLLTRYQRAHEVGVPTLACDFNTHDDVNRTGAYSQDWQTDS